MPVPFNHGIIKIMSASMICCSFCASQRYLYFISIITFITRVSKKKQRDQKEDHGIHFVQNVYLNWKKKRREILTKYN